MANGDNDKERIYAVQLADRLHAFIWDSMTTNNCNTYLIDGPTRILIDPGHARLFSHVESGLLDLGLNLDDIGLVLCTHPHPDHIEAVQLFKNTKAQFTLHRAAWKALKAMEKQISLTMGVDLAAIEPDFLLKEGDLSVDGIDLRVFHSPGHAPGSASVYWPAQKALFSGDVIFEQALGRTDLPGGDGGQLKESIHRLSQLEIQWLCSGHGAVVSGVEAVKQNFDYVIQNWFNYI